MKYMGSKSKIAKHIVPILQDIIDKNGITVYVEPFVGGANVIDKISCQKRVGGDRQQYLIALYQNLDKLPTLPENVSHEHYADVRTHRLIGDGKYPDWYTGAIGFLASYNGRFFDGGYAGIVHTKAGTVRNYYQEARKNLEAQVPKLDGIEFLSGDYRETCSHFENALIYCDPPYHGTKQYGTGSFYHDEFWDWCRWMSERNVVIVSENTARDDFECIWEQPITRTMNNRELNHSVERLFQYDRREEP